MDELGRLQRCRSKLLDIFKSSPGHEAKEAASLGITLIDREIAALDKRVEYPGMLSDLGRLNAATIGDTPAPVEPTPAVNPRYGECVAQLEKAARAMLRADREYEQYRSLLIAHGAYLKDAPVDANGRVIGFMATRDELIMAFEAAAKVHEAVHPSRLQAITGPLD
jgi:hypothetical protein